MAPTGRPHFEAIVAFLPLHAACLLLIWTPFEWSFVAWLVATYAIRMFGITAGYHRYFAHRSFELNRVFQFALAFLAQSSAQMGVLWWVAHHRAHHRYSDTDNDVHSPAVRSFWWAHIGWILDRSSREYDRRSIQDLEKFPELRLLDKYHRTPAILFGAAVFALGGFHVFLWGFVLSTVLLWHGTFTINSLAHLWGSRPLETKDQSRNNFVLALITLGEGWHNNHHQFMGSARQGLRWWEIDVTYYVLWFLSLFGIVRELRARSSPAVLRVRVQS